MTVSGRRDFRINLKIGYLCCKSNELYFQNYNSKTENITNLLVSTEQDSSLHDSINHPFPSNRPLTGSNMSLLSVRTPLTCSTKVYIYSR